MQIENIISNKLNPLVNINRVTSRRVQRCMGFIYKNYSKKIKLVATAVHNFYDFPVSEFNLYLGNSKYPLSKKSGIITDGVYDIAFIVVKDTRLIDNIALHPKDNIEIVRGDEELSLTNIKNVFNPDEHNNYPYLVQSQSGVTRSKEVEIIPYNDLDKLFVLDIADKQGISEAEKRGFAVYNTLNMISSVGCSGSPILDENLNLYGINIRGNKREADKIAYLPTNKIEEIYKRLLPKINKYL